MAVNFAKAADVLRQELDLFYAAVGQCEDPRPVVARLRTALRRAETTTAAFPEGWGDLDRNQRWGYARLVSVVKVSQYELSKFGDEPEKQDFSNQTRKSLDEEKVVSQKRPTSLRRKHRNEQESYLRRPQPQPLPVYPTFLSLLVIFSSDEARIAEQQIPADTQPRWETSSKRDSRGHSDRLTPMRE